MKTASLFLTALTIIACTPVRCMEKKPLLSVNTVAHTSQTQFNANPHSYQQAPTPTRSTAPTSKSLKEILAARNPNFEPLLAQENREKNIALIESIGGHDIKTKLFGAFALVCALNCAKDIVCNGIWGTQPRFPLTDLILPNHSIPLNPCVRQCDGFCTSPLTCVPTSCEEWKCNVQPDPLITTIGWASGSTMTANILGTATGMILALRNHRKKCNAQKDLEALLKELDDITQDSDVCLLSTDEKAHMENSALKTAITTMLDGQIALDVQQKDQVAFEEERTKIIELITRNGTNKSIAKMWALIASIFLLNAVKEMVFSSLWGYDTMSPLTPLIPPNHLLPTTPCQQVCWVGGCCDPDCDPGACASFCDGWKCASEVSTLNAFGKTSLSTFSVNGAGFIASSLAAAYYWMFWDEPTKQLKQLLKKLDEMAASSPENA